MATAAKIETAAEKYRRIKREKESKQQLFDMTCPDPECGMVWKVRQASKEFWVTSGILPMHLVEKMLTANGSVGNQENVLKSLATKEILESVVFASKVVKYTAVEPAIKETPSGPNDISQEEVMTCCYTALLNWQMKGGGDEAERLETFPKE